MTLPPLTDWLEGPQCSPALNGARVEVHACYAESNAAADKRARSAFAAAHTDVSFGPRPQDGFNPPVDNSNAPFRPRLDHWAGFQVG